MTKLIAVVAVLLFVVTYVSWIASRIDRLTARVEAAWASLDAQLVRRAAAAAQLAAYERRHGGLADDKLKPMEYAAAAARTAAAADRQDAENDLTRGIRAALATGALRGTRADDLFVDLRDSSTKADFARQFYNDAVRDNGSLRRKYLCRLLCAFRRDPVRGYFEIADTAIVAERGRSEVSEGLG
ncbi:MAG: NUDIX hydrolase [Mycobacteriales bacterium]